MRVRDQLHDLRHVAQVYGEPSKLGNSGLTGAIQNAYARAPHTFLVTGITLVLDVRFPGEWPLDRTLGGDVLVNALQNACRHAGSKVIVMAEVNEEGLSLSVNDDGSGFPDVAMAHLPEEQSGLGLFIAARIAAIRDTCHE